MALLDLGHVEHGLVEGVECDRSRIGKLDLHEGDMAFAGLLAVDDGGVAPDHALLLQPPHAGLDRRLRQAHPFGERGHGKAPLA